MSNGPSSSCLVIMFYQPRFNKFVFRASEVGSWKSMCYVPSMSSILHKQKSRYVGPNGHQKEGSCKPYAHTNGGISVN